MPVKCFLRFMFAVECVRFVVPLPEDAVKFITFKSLLCRPLEFKYLFTAVNLVISGCLYHCLRCNMDYKKNRIRQNFNLYGQWLVNAQSTGAEFGLTLGGDRIRTFRYIGRPISRLRTTMTTRKRKKRRMMFLV